MILINTNNLYEGMILGKNIYNAEGKILLDAGKKLTKKYIDKLKKLFISQVYIETPYSRDLKVDDIIDNDTRISAIKSMSKMLVRAQVVRMISKNEFEAVKQIIQKFIHDLLRKKNQLAINFMDIKPFDNYTAAHSVNTAVLSLVLGIKLDLPREVLLELGISAMLHDIGKGKISLKIISKPDKLDSNEFFQMKRHPIYGYELLKNTGVASELILNGILQHHEKINGTGYPQMLEKDRIHQFGRIISVADVYDALTSDRVYKSKVLPNIAKGAIIRSAGKHFDSEICRIFNDNIVPFPVCVPVKLSNGMVGIVKKINFHDLDNPEVLIIKDENNKNIEKPYVTNLFNEKQLNIIAVEKEFKNVS